MARNDRDDEEAGREFETSRDGSDESESRRLDERTERAWQLASEQWFVPRTKRDTGGTWFRIRGLDRAGLLDALVRIEETRTCQYATLLLRDPLAMTQPGDPFSTVEEIDSGRALSLTRYHILESEGGASSMDIVFVAEKKAGELQLRGYVEWRGFCPKSLEARARFDLYFQLALELQQQARASELALAPANPERPTRAGRWVRV